VLQVDNFVYMQREFLKFIMLNPNCGYKELIEEFYPNSDSLQKKENNARQIIFSLKRKNRIKRTEENRKARFSLNPKYVSNVQDYINLSKK
jgi:hypothetical protein